MRGQIASVKYGNPAYTKTICFRCRFFDGDTLNPARMGYCKLNKKNEVITVKTKCEKYQPKENYQ